MNQQVKIIKIAAFDNGGHGNQDGRISHVPDGWAVIPDDMETPNFPFGKIKTKEIDGVMTVTKWTAETVPKVLDKEGQQM